MKPLVALILILLCFIAPIDHGVMTEQMDLPNRTSASLALLVVILLMSTNWWAFIIAVIELALIGVNLDVSYHWDTSTVFDAHYTSINRFAFALEVLIVIIPLGASMIDYRNYRNTHGSWNRLFRGNVN